MHVPLFDLTVARIVIVFLKMKAARNRMSSLSRYRPIGLLAGAERLLGGGDGRERPQREDGQQRGPDDSRTHGGSFQFHF